MGYALHCGVRPGEWGTPWLEGYALRCGYTMLEMSAYPLQWEWGEGGRYTQPWDRTPPAASASSGVPGAARGGSRGRMVGLS